MEKSWNLNDYDVMEVLSNLSLEEKLELSKVSKQFNDCVHRLLKSQKELQISIAISDRETDYGFDLEIREILMGPPVRVLDMNEIKIQFEPLLIKFTTLTTLKLRINTSNDRYFEWLNKTFPTLKSIEIVIKEKDIWNSNTILSFKSVFGQRCESIKTERFHIPVQFRNQLFTLPSIRSIDLIGPEDEENLVEIFIHLPKNISSVKFTLDLSESLERVLETLISRNGKHIQKLDIYCRNFSGVNQYLTYIFENFLEIKCLSIVCAGIVSLESIICAKNLEKLKIRSIDYSVICFPKSDLTVSTRLRVLIIEDSRFYSVFCSDMEKAFSNIEYVELKRLVIHCNCIQFTKVCFKCYTKFLTICTKVYERKMVSKIKSSISLQFSPRSEPNIIFLSIFETFMETKISLNIESYHSLVDDEVGKREFISLVLNGLIQTAHRKPKIKLCLKIVNNSVESQVRIYEQILPSNMKIESIGKECVLENKINDGKEFFIYLYQNPDNILVKLGSNTSITRRVRISFGFFFD